MVLHRYEINVQITKFKITGNVADTYVENFGWPTNV